MTLRDKAIFHLQKTLRYYLINNIIKDDCMHHLLIFLSCCFLLGCGGGGSSSEPTPPAESVTEPTPPAESVTEPTPPAESVTEPSPEPKKNIFNLTLTYSDHCGQKHPATDAALVLHNDDLSTQQTLYADNEGKIAYEAELEQTKQSLTIVGYAGEGAKANQQHTIKTFINHSLTGNFTHDLGKIDSITCSCETGSVQVNPSPSESRSLIAANLQVNNRSYRQRSPNITGTFGDVKICNNAQGTGSNLSAITSYGELEQKSEYGSYTKNFQLGDSLTANIIGTPVNIIASEQTSVKTLIDDSFHFNSSELVYSPEGAQGYMYDTVSFDYYFMNQIDSHIYLLNISQYFSTQLESSVNLTVNDQTFGSVFDFITNEDGYDLTTIGEVDLVRINTSASLTEGSVSWSITAPSAGAQLELQNIDLNHLLVANLFNNVNSVSIYLEAWGSDKVENYSDIYADENEPYKQNFSSQVKTLSTSVANHQPNGLQSLISLEQIKLIQESTHLSN